MTDSADISFPVQQPNLQISFYFKLQSIRKLYFQEAIRQTIESLDVQAIDEQLSRYVEPEYLKKAASYGLRGEVFFPVPCLMERNPFLLGYYRLLLGLSQKEFYSKGPFGRFKGFEERGEIPPHLEDQVPALCSSLIQSAQLLVKGLDDLSLSIVHELQLLTLGPQLRGGSNTSIGQEATKEFFAIMKSLVADYTKEITKRTIHIQNDSKRNVLIEFSSDPDVSITEQLRDGPSAGIHRD